MKIAIYTKSFDKSFLSYFKLFCQLLSEKNAELFLHKNAINFLTKKFDWLPQTYKEFSLQSQLVNIDLMCSIGGDGTFLETASFIGKCNIPIMGINSGRLGFLASIAKEEINDAVEAIFADELQYEQRTLLELSSPQTLFQNFPYALNELTVHKKDSSAMITVHAFVNDIFLNSYWADGLIVATPTGSTAYSLSVGGPIVMPQSQNFIITPIASHTLTVRPVVIPDSEEITLHIEGRNPNVLVSMDSRVATIKNKIQIKLKRANFTITTAKLPHQQFFCTIRNKLVWGMDKRNYTEPTIYSS